MRRFVCLLLALLLACASIGAGAEGLDDAAEYLKAQFPDPLFGSEWFICALSAADAAGESNFSGYIASAAEAAKAGFSKATDAARVVLALTAIGVNAADLDGVDLTRFLSDSENVIRQGQNGVCYALLALDAGAYPSDARAGYVAYILSRQLPDGGWAYTGSVADPDMTAIACRALAPYRAEDDAGPAIERAVDRLAELALPDGGYRSFGVVCSESVSQVLLALAALDLLEDPRFSGAASALMAYQLPSGGFSHVPGGEENNLATIQAVLALSVIRGQQNE